MWSNTKNKNSEPTRTGAVNSMSPTHQTTGKQENPQRFTRFHNQRGCPTRLTVRVLNPEITWIG
ncbi:MAG: hypothetical protein C4527_21455 [Candidatus Omnitrophota bacterium]|jgi:hypothetical protein|nr:MAG: hypothetical protein C4527_21455 [Candidatus Omnitrophota bacterium]